MVVRIALGQRVQRRIAHILPLPEAREQPLDIRLAGHLALKGGVQHVIGNALHGEPVTVSIHPIELLLLQVADDIELLALFLNAVSLLKMDIGNRVDKIALRPVLGISIYNIIRPLLHSSRPIVANTMALRAHDIPQIVEGKLGYARLLAALQSRFHPFLCRFHPAIPSSAAFAALLSLIGTWSSTVGRRSRSAQTSRG